jgi:hypothetical protein
MDIPTSFTWIIILFDEVFKYGDDDEKFWSYVGTNAEPLCVEFLNSVKYHLCKVFNSLWNNVRKVGVLVLSRTSYLNSVLEQPTRFT